MSQSFERFEPSISPEVYASKQDTIHKQHADHLSNMIEAFFSEDTVSKSLQYMMSRQDQYQHDVLADTLSTAISCAVFPCITECGVAFFEQHPMLIMAYRDMTARQLTACLRYLTFLEELSIYSGSNQMGGGSRVTPIRVHFPNVHVDPSVLIFGCKIILEHNLPAEVDLEQVMNVVLQRIVNSTFISRERIVASEAMWRKHMQKKS